MGMNKDKITFQDEITKSTLSIKNAKGNLVPFYHYGFFSRMRWIQNVTGSYLEDILVYI